jgi:hypothetical protein
MKEDTMNRYWTLSGKPVANWPEPDTFTMLTGACSLW